jgi:hypothetical protein
MSAAERFADFAASHSYLRRNFRAVSRRARLRIGSSDSCERKLAPVALFCYGAARGKFLRFCGERVRTDLTYEFPGDGPSGSPENPPSERRHEGRSHALLSTLTTSVGFFPMARAQEAVYVPQNPECSYPALTLSNISPPRAALRSLMREPSRSKLGKREHSFSGENQRVCARHAGSVGVRA